MARHLRSFPPIVRTYRLFSPVIAFLADEKQIIQIPAGTVIKLETMGGRRGVKRSSFEGRTVFVQCIDVEENGKLVEAEG